MTERILVVDDDPRMVRLVGEILKAAGYGVICASSGEGAIQKVALDAPDLLLLDIRLEGGVDGYEVCRRLREFCDVPIIMLTARASEEDLLRGFDVGADDYLTKPFSAKELVARIRAALRRSAHHEEVITASFACERFEVNYARRTVTVAGSTLSLTPIEYRLLAHLTQNANRVLTHEDLLTTVWGPEYRDDVDYLRVYIRHLRRKLEADPSRPQIILTSPGVGYVLTCSVE